MPINIAQDKLIPCCLRLRTRIVVALLQDDEERLALTDQNGANILLRERVKMGQKVCTQLFQYRMQPLRVHQVFPLLYACRSAILLARSPASTDLALYVQAADHTVFLRTMGSCCRA
mgnify:CR=1 FL=1